MKQSKGLLRYYTEYIDTDGKQHYAIHMYDDVSKWVWSMRDYKFPGLQYKQTKCNAEYTNI